MRFALVTLLALSVAVPAHAKSNHDVYPMSCDMLWAAVKGALNNPNDYAILGVNDLSQKAWFIVVGDLKSYTDNVAVTPQGNGCAMKLAMYQIGSDNSDERGFRHRLKRSLAKVQAAIAAKPAAATPGQASTESSQ
jgi:hypothetical protein